MARIVIIGAGTIGLTAAMLGYHEDHDVTVIERDPAPAPDPQRACGKLAEERRRPVPAAASLLGPVRSNRVARTSGVGGSIRRHGRPRVEPDRRASRRRSPAGDVPGMERFDVITGRRPFMEAVAATHAADLGIEIRRGVAVSGLEHRILGDGTVDVTGVIVMDGAIHADLVVDASRAPILDGDDAAFSRPTHGPTRTGSDSGYVYFARHYRGKQTMPPLRGALLQPYGSISIATLPAEPGSWSVVVFASSGDRAVTGLRRVDAWERVVRWCPIASHWIDAEPITGIDVMAPIEDRRCDYLVDGRLTTISVVPIGDALASTSPSLGRGRSFGVMHAGGSAEMCCTKYRSRIAAAWPRRSTTTPDNGSHRGSTTRPRPISTV